MHGFALFLLFSALSGVVNLVAALLCNFYIVMLRTPHLDYSKPFKFSFLVFSSLTPRLSPRVAVRKLRERTGTCE